MGREKARGAGCLGHQQQSRDLLGVPMVAAGRSADAACFKLLGDSLECGARPLDLSNNRPRRGVGFGRLLRPGCELWPEVGDGGNREGGISWGCLTTSLLHRRSDMPCPKITSSSCFSQETWTINSLQ